MFPFMGDKKKIAQVIVERMRPVDKAKEPNPLEPEAVPEDSGLGLADNLLAALDAKEPKGVLEAMRALVMHVQANDPEEAAESEGAPV